ncbi:MAG: DUF4956 domain-containing protein [Anaerolineae bacterium]
MLETTPLIAGFIANLAIVIFIVRFIYYPAKQNKNYVFTFVAFNTMIFLVMSLLTSSEISIGVGFGLFAIFSVLRYRTDPIPIREMTYLFIIIALPVMNSVLIGADQWAIWALTNFGIVSVLFVLEQGWGFAYESSKRITYEQIDLIKPENYALLLDDLKTRTGLPIRKALVGRIDFLKDTAEIKIFYDDPAINYWHQEEFVTLKDAANS